MNATGSESALSDFKSSTLTQQNVAQRYTHVVKPADKLQLAVCMHAPHCRTVFQRVHLGFPLKNWNII